MKTVPSRIGSTDVLFAASDEETEVAGGEGAVSVRTEELSPYAPTSAGDTAKKVVGDAYLAIKEVIRSISEDIGDRLNSIELARRPRRVEMEIGIGVAGKGKLIIINGEAKAGVKVKLTWECGSDK